MPHLARLIESVVINRTGVDWQPSMDGWPLDHDCADQNTEIALELSRNSITFLRDIQL